MVESSLADCISSDKIQNILSVSVSLNDVGMILVDTAGSVVFKTGNNDFCNLFTPGKDGLIPINSVIDSLDAQKTDAVEAGLDLCYTVFPISVNCTLAGGLLFSSVNNDKNRDLFSVLHCHIQHSIDTNFELESLSKEIVRNYEELALLYELSTRLGSKPDIDSTCYSIATETIKVIQAESISIMLIDEARGKVSSRVSLSSSNRTYPPHTLNLGEGITGGVIASKEPVIVGSVLNHPKFVPLPYPVKSLLVVPLIVRDKVIGTINVSDKITGEVFTTNDEKLLMSISQISSIAVHNSILFQEVTGLFWNTVKSLTSAIDAKDKYTMGHSKRVADITMVISREMRINDESMDDIKLAALLHDIGKIGISEKILFKRGALTGAEWEEVKKHPYHSSNILKEIKQFHRVAEWVMHEHERYDGLGYPKNLSGNAIPLPSRIIAVADAFDAMTSDRSYRAGMSDEEAIALLKNGAGSQFDPKVVEAFLVAYSNGTVRVDKEFSEPVLGEDARHD